MPAAIPLLLELFAYAGLFLAIGMLVMGQKFTEALFQVTEAGVGWIPWLGKKAANGVHAVGKRINAVFSAAVLKLEGAAAETWHLMAIMIEQTGAAIWDATKLGAHALWLVEVKYPLDVLSYLAHKGVQAAGAGAKVTNVTVQKVYKTAGITRAQLAHLTRRIDHLEARLKAAAIAVPGVIALPFPRIGALERGAHRARVRIGKLEHRFGRKAFAASVATALGVLGLSWVRRSCVKRNNDLLCKTDFGALEGLLAGAVLVVGSQSVVRFANAMLAAEDEFVGVLSRMVTELGDVTE